MNALKFRGNRYYVMQLKCMRRVTAHFTKCAGWMSYECCWREWDCVIYVLHVFECYFQILTSFRPQNRKSNSGYTHPYFRKLKHNMLWNVVEWSSVPNTLIQSCILKHTNFFKIADWADAFGLWVRAFQSKTSVRSIWWIFLLLLLLLILKSAC